MSARRVEQFSDAVIAIIITVMVIELRIPHGKTWSALRDSVPVLLTYLLSFVYLAIYWNNHHHLLMATERVNALVLWANLHLLFWLSLLPAVTHWAGENHLASWPTAMYGVVLLMSAIAYFILIHALIREHGRDSPIARAVGNDVKGKVSVVIYLAGIGVAFVAPWVSATLYALAAVWWFVPDRRIEHVLEA
jgi:uncharacterized membrane protein